MKIQDALRDYDFDLPLMDALNDPDLSVDRRVLAGAAVGIGLDIAFLATNEMLEAFMALGNDVRDGVIDGDGRKDLQEILSQRNPFQMRLWYLLFDTPFERACDDLSWLKSVTYRRGRMAVAMAQQKLAIVYGTNAELCESRTTAQLLDQVSALG